MSRPSKRPRLQFLGSVSPDPDGELAVARARNDGLLKTRWEHIFQRYEKDFDGIGDEISMLDDEIVVDNGHIKSMRNARDTGNTDALNHHNPTTKYDGQRILRAMTVAPSETSDISASDIDAEQVLQSIETIADNLAMGNDSSEDELFDAYPAGGEGLSTIPYLRQNTDYYEEASIKSESEVDSLFDTRPIMRSPSVDDLFEPGSPGIPESRSSLVYADHRNGIYTTETPETSLYSLPPNEPMNRDIIREEIWKALGEQNQAQEAKIEPAWRIPIHLPVARAPRVDSEQVLAISKEPVISTSDDELDLDSHSPVWQPPTRPRRSRREVIAERNIKRLRAESEDPLQDGFTSETEETSPNDANSTERPLPEPAGPSQMMRLPHRDEVSQSSPSPDASTIFVNSSHPPRNESQSAMPDSDPLAMWLTRPQLPKTLSVKPVFGTSAVLKPTKKRGSS